MPSDSLRECEPLHRVSWLRELPGPATRLTVNYTVSGLIPTLMHHSGARAWIRGLERGEVGGRSRRPHPVQEPDNTLGSGDVDDEDAVLEAEPFGRANIAPAPIRVRVDAHGHAGSDVGRVDYVRASIVICLKALIRSISVPDCVS